MLGKRGLSPPHSSSSPSASSSSPSLTSSSSSSSRSSRSSSSSSSPFSPASDSALALSSSSWASFIFFSASLVTAHRARISNQDEAHYCRHPYHHLNDKRSNLKRSPSLWRGRAASRFRVHSDVEANRLQMCPPS